MTSERVSDSRRLWKAERMLDSYLLHFSLYFSEPILLNDERLKHIFWFFKSKPELVADWDVAQEMERKTKQQLIGWPDLALLEC